MKESYPVRWIFLSTIGKIEPENQDAIIDWLNDRSKFHVWLTSIVTGSIVFLTAVDIHPQMLTSGRIISLLSLSLMFLSILANMVCVWSIPTWKLGIRTGKIRDGRMMRWDLGSTAWIGVLAFLAGLLLSAIATILE